MKNNFSFIESPLIFARQREQLFCFCAMHKRLPQKVFAQKFNCFYFEEFDWVLSADFWNSLQILSRKSSDELVLVNILDPDPIAYYKKEFGHYNWALIAVSSTADDYWKLLNHSPMDSLADSILINSQRLVLSVPSASWIIWGERSLEICVLACVDKKIGDCVSWRNIDWVANYIEQKSCNLENDSSKLIKKLRDNYGHIGGAPNT